MRLKGTSNGDFTINQLHIVEWLRFKRLMLVVRIDKKLGRERTQAKLRPWRRKAESWAVHSIKASNINSVWTQIGSKMSDCCEIFEVPETWHWRQSKQLKNRLEVKAQPQSVEPHFNLHLRRLPWFCLTSSYSNEKCASNLAFAGGKVWVVTYQWQRQSLQ